jgi:hypothetical protein
MPDEDAAEATAQIDLGEALGELRRLAGRRRDTDVRRGLAHLAQHRVDDRGAPRRLLERRRVAIRDPLEVVVAAGELRARATHPAAHVLPREQQLERGLEVVLLALVHRHLQGDVRRELGEPAHVRDDDGLAERECPDHAAGGLAHRGVAQVHAHVAGHQCQTAPLSTSLARGPRREPQALDPRSRSKPGESADEEAAAGWRSGPSVSEELGDRLLEFDAEAADDEGLAARSGLASAGRRDAGPASVAKHGRGRRRLRVDDERRRVLEHERRGGNLGPDSQRGGCACRERRARGRRRHRGLAHPSR